MIRAQIEDGEISSAIVITAILCQLVWHDEDDFPNLIMLAPTDDEVEIVWFSPAEKVGLKGMWVHWHQVAFLGFDDGVPF